MPDTKVLVSMDLPLRECTTCTWSGIILSNALPEFDIEGFIRRLGWAPETTENERTIAVGNLRNLCRHLLTYRLEIEPVDGPDRCGFCPECGETLKVRNS
jgi:hypothetical protein